MRILTCKVGEFSRQAGRLVSGRPFIGGSPLARKDNIRTKTAKTGWPSRMRCCSRYPCRGTRRDQAPAPRRSDCGDMPKARTKARRMRLASPKPVDAAMWSRPRWLVSTAMRADSRRRPSTTLAGVAPISAANARAKLRGLGEARAHPADQLAEAPGAATAFHQGGILRLPTMPSLMHHQLLRRASRDGGAEVVLDQRQRQVDPRGNARRGPQLAVPHEHPVGIQAHFRVAQPEAFGRVPVRGGAPAVEQAGLRQEECAGADARRAPP